MSDAADKSSSTRSTPRRASIDCATSLWMRKSAVRRSALLSSLYAPTTTSANTWLVDESEVLSAQLGHGFVQFALVYLATHEQRLIANGYYVNQEIIRTNFKRTPRNERPFTRSPRHQLNKVCGVYSTLFINRTGPMPPSADHPDYWPGSP